MNHIALYRKYRPKSFEEVIGQEHITKTLQNQILNNQIGHAYLFTGTRGTGKTSVAKIFAKAVNCLNPVNGSCCGECENCKRLEQENDINIIELDAASNNKVDDIRQIRDKIVWGSLWTSVVAKMKITYEGGSSNVFKRALNALSESMWTSSTM